MNTSQQAAGGRHLAPSNPAFPFRCIIFEFHAEGTCSLACVFEMATEHECEMAALDVCTEPYSTGVVAMHYIVGEIA